MKQGNDNIQSNGTNKFTFHNTNSNTILCTIDTNKQIGKMLEISDV